MILGKKGAKLAIGRHGGGVGGWMKCKIRLQFAVAGSWGLTDLGKKF